MTPVVSPPVDEICATAAFWVDQATVAPGIAAPPWSRTVAVSVVVASSDEKLIVVAESWIENGVGSGSVLELHAARTRTVARSVRREDRWHLVGARVGRDGKPARLPAVAPS